jgi:hypothetical protein
MWGKLCLPNCVHKKNVGSYVYQIVHIENVVIMSTKLFRQNCVNYKFTKKQFMGGKSHGRSFSIFELFLHDHLCVYYETSSIVTLWVNFIILENQQIGLKCKNATFDSKLNVWYAMLNMNWLNP